jgi:hypothetical protein
LLETKQAAKEVVTRFFDLEDILTNQSSLQTFVLQGKEVSLEYGKGEVEKEEIPGIHITRPGFHPFLGWDAFPCASVTNPTSLLLRYKNKRAKTYYQ